MTNHRSSTDAQFDTHLGTLTESTIDAKITAWEALQTDLGGEKTEVEGHRSQVFKHRKKVADMLEDLDTLKSYAQVGITQAQLDAVIADVTALQAPTAVTVYTPTSNNQDTQILQSDKVVLIKFVQLQGLTATLPSTGLVDGQQIVIKCYHVGDGSQQDIGVDYLITVRPASGQTPAHKIDYKFDSLTLNANSLASGDYASPNEACRLIWNAADASWIDCADNY
jgi:uncharacterized membrane-anchored protein YhcB (DUF1043 family)